MSFWDDLLSEKVLAAALPSVVTTVGGLFAGGGSNDGELTFEQRQQLQNDELANRLAIAQLQAGAAGSGSGAAVAAARITDARERLRMKQEAQQALLSGRLKAAEALSPEVLSDLMTARQQLAQRAAESNANNYGNLMQALGGGYVRGQQNTIGRG